MRHHFHHRNSLLLILLAFSLLLPAGSVHATVFGGYSEYYVPGREEQVWDILNDIDDASAAAPNGFGNYLSDPSTTGLRSIISITASGDNTVVYYDHWEDGYGFDADDPENTYDERYVLQAGEVLELDSPDVPVSPRGTAQYYDGGDRFYVAGTSVAVSRTLYPAQTNVLTTFALSWEVYPIKPFLTDYTVPVGEDLVAAKGYDDFQQTYVLVMSTEDGNLVQIDNPGTVGVDKVVTLDRGESDTLFHIDAGTRVTATAPVQVQFIVANDRGSFEMRGFVAVPDNLWDNEYYNPVDGEGDGDTPSDDYDTDLYIYNPNTTAITVQWEDLDNTGTRRTGTFTVQPLDTVAYSDSAAAGHYVAEDSGVYLRSDDIFWAIGSGDTESTSMDWGYSLLPASFLTNEYYMGWSPAWAPGQTAGQPGSPAFVTAVGDETTISVDYDGDGAEDDSYIIDRLESLRIFDTSDNNLAGTRISASGPIAVAWGIDPDNSEPGSPYLDLGSTVLPFPEEWVDVTLGIVHDISPSVVGPQAGETSTVTLTINTADFPVNGVSVTDLLPAGWVFVDDSATITLPGGGGQITGNSADPVTYTDANGLPALEWTNGILGGLNMAPNQTLTIEFTIATDNTIDASDIGTHVSTAQATGYRLGGSQVFTPFDSEFLNVTAMTVDMDTSTPLVEAGGTASYTIRVDNITDATIDQIEVSDDLPAGFTNAGGNAVITFYDAAGAPFTPGFPVDTGNDGSWGFADGDNWSLGPGEYLVITYDVEVGGGVAANTYDSSAESSFRLNGSTYTINDIGTAGQDLGTPDDADPEEDEDVTVYEYNLAINKKRGAGQNATVSPGDTVTYTIYVENQGSSTATNLEIDDTLPDGFTFDSETSITLGGAGASRTSTSAPSSGDSILSWGTWDINAGGSIEIAFVVDVPTDAPAGTYDNTAIARVMDSPGGTTILYAVDDAGAVGGDSGTPASGGQQDVEDDEDITVGAPALTVDKDTSTPFAQNGSEVAYTIRVDNTGTADATNVSVTDSLPGGFSYNVGQDAVIEIYSAGSDPAMDSPASTFTDANDGTYGGSITLAPGEFVIVTFTATAGGGAGIYDSNASAAADGGISVDDIGTVAQDDDTPALADPENDEDVEVFAVNTTVDLSIAKSHTTDFEVGGTNQYTIVVTNNGPGTEDETVTVVDSLPVGLSYDTFSGTGWSYISTVGQDVTFAYDGAATPLDPGETATLTVSVTVDKDTAPASVTNLVSVSSPSTDPVSANNSDTDSTDIRIPDLSTAAKTVQDLNGGTVEPGDVLQYIVTLTETGGYEATGVSVTDDIPDYVTGFTVISTPAGSVNSSTGAGTGANGNGFLNVTGITVAAGGTATIIYQVTVDGGAVAGNQIVNGATVANPKGPGATPTADTLEVSLPQAPASGNKPIYLDDDNNLSRTPPAAPQTFVGVANSGSRTWTLDPALQLDLTIDGDGGSIAVPLVLRSQGASGTVSHSVTVTLATIGDTVLTIGSRTQSVSLTGTESAQTFTITVAADVDLTAGTRLTLTVAQTNAGGRTLDVFPIASFDANVSSQIELVSENVINVDSVAFYTGAYPSGSLTDRAEPGTDVYVRAVVSDPFGSQDIASATLYVVDSQGAVVVDAEAMPLVADSGAATRTYEYGFTMPDDGSDPDYLTATVRAVEGTEGTVTHTGAETVDVSAGVGADLSLVKSHQGTFAVGTQESFTLLVTNHGPFAHSAGSPITVTDTFPAGLTYAAFTGTGWSTSDGPGDSPVTWTYTPASDVAPGATLPAIEVFVDVDAAAIPSVENEATVSLGQGTDGNPENNTANNTARDTAYVSQLGVTKVSDAASPYYDGDLNVANEITYTVTVTNNGQAPVTNVKVVDTLTPALAYVPNSTMVEAPKTVFRVTEYYFNGSTRNFSGTSFDLTLDQDLAQNYFVMVQGSAGDGTAGGNRGPDASYARLTGDPFGTGDLTDLAQNDAIRLEREAATDSWVGVVTVVESLSDTTTAGFRLRDVQVLTHANGDDFEFAATDWDSIDQVLLMGGFNGAGCTSPASSNADNNVCHTRLAPIEFSGTDYLVSYRGGNNTGDEATVTVMLVEWGSEWTVQRVQVTGTTAGGGGANTSGQYLTGALGTPVARSNTWVWGTGFTEGSADDQADGIGEAAEAVLITLGDDLAYTDTQGNEDSPGDAYTPPNTTENQVAVGMEIDRDIDFEIYTMTHPTLSVAYRFKTDGDDNELTVDVDTDAAPSQRMALVTNGCNGNGTAWPRPIFSARYADNDTIRLERRRWDQPFPAWIQGIDFSGFSNVETSAGNAPDELVAAADAYSLLPGETMTVTYQATLADATDPGAVTNTVYASSTNFPDPASDAVTLDVRTEPITEFTDIDGNTKTSFDYTEAGGETIHLRTYDPDRNVDPNTRESIQVTVSNPMTGDSVTYILYETGVNTGDFAYARPFVSDPAGNTDPGAVETIEVEITNPDTGDPQTVTLTETGPDTGEFTSTEVFVRAMLLLDGDGPMDTGDNYLYVTPGSSPDLNIAYSDPFGRALDDQGAAVAAVSTRAVIAAFDAVEKGGDVAVVWETASEVKTLGFFLERLNPATGEFERVGARLVPGLFNAVQGGTYQHVDAGAVPGGTYTYRLIEIEAPGREIVLGPYSVTVDDNPALAALPDFDGDFFRAPHAPNALPDAQPMMMAMALAPLAVETGDVLKVSLTEDGLVTVTAAALAAKFGRTEEAVSALIGAGELSVTLSGEPVRYLAAADHSAIYFYGQAPQSVYTAENVYWVSEGSGALLPLSPTDSDLDGDGNAGLSDAQAALQIMVGISPAGIPDGHPVAEADIDGDGKVGPAEAIYALQGEAGLRGGAGASASAAADTGVFPHTAHFEQDLSAITDYTDDPDSDYWNWDTLIAYLTTQDGNVVEISDDFSHPFTVHDVTEDSAAARIVVHLQSLSDTAAAPDHHVQVSLNGDVIADATWDGAVSFDLSADIDADTLLAGDNANTLTILARCDTGTAYSYVSVDSFDVIYPRRFKAVDDRLAFTAGNNAEVTVSGFSESAVYVFDITDPVRPMQVAGAAVSAGDDGFQIRFSPTSSEARYLATTLAGAASPSSVAVDTPSTLSDAANEGEYLIITPQELVDAVQVLADYRRGQGMGVHVVRLEDIMDEFNYGIFSPEVIRTFLSYARDNWAVPPEYVVLIGEGNYDYRNVTGLDDNIMPPEMVGTPDGLFASDNSLADLDGNDGVPEMAIGRLPVATAAELSMLIDKIVTYEAQAPADWQKRVLLAADLYDGSGGDFAGDSDAAAAFVPDGYSAEKIYLASDNPADVFAARTALLTNGINAGALLVNYIGHGGYFNMSGEGLMVEIESPSLNMYDVSSLTNGYKLPVVSAFSCVLGRFDYPNGFDGLSEKLLMQEGGGAVAVFSSAGLSINAKARYLNEEFFRALFVDNQTVLGDAVVQALRRYRQRTGDSLVPRTYNLLGDPALRIHLNQGPS